MVLGKAANILPFISSQSVLLNSPVLITTNSVEIVVAVRTSDLAESRSHELLGHLGNWLSGLELTTSIKLHMVSLLEECFLLKRPAVVVSVISLHPKLEVDLTKAKLVSSNLCKVNKQFRVGAAGRRCTCGVDLLAVIHEEKLHLTSGHGVEEIRQQ